VPPRTCVTAAREIASTEDSHFPPGSRAPTRPLPPLPQALSATGWAHQAEPRGPSRQGDSDSPRSDRLMLVATKRRELIMIDS
jgi:hypothetical protein